MHEVTILEDFLTGGLQYKTYTFDVFLSQKLRPSCTFESNTRMIVCVLSAIGINLPAFYYECRSLIGYATYCTIYSKNGAKENLVMNNRDNRVFMSRNDWSDSCPLEI